MKYLIGIGIGAIIGYFTNWLAIKMLFKPHNEVRFLGVKVPFTPGLIPKEKERIANSVGNAVGYHLLDKETIIESLCSEKINNSIKSYFDEKIENMKENDNTVEEFIEETININLENSIRTNIPRLIENDNLVETLKYEGKGMLESQLLTLMNENPKNILNSYEYENFIKNLADKGNEYLGGNEIRERLEGVLNNKLENLGKSELTIKEVLPKGAIVALKVYVCNNRKHIADYLKNLLKQEKVEGRVKSGIDSAISGMSPMIAMFLRSDVIYDKIVEYSDTFLSQEENIDEISIIVTEAIDNILESPIREVLENLSLENKKDIIDSVVNFIINELNENGIAAEFIKNLEEKLFKSKETIDNILESLNLDSKKIVTGISNIIIEKVFIKENLNKITDSMTVKIASSIKKAKVKEIFYQIDDRVITNISENMVKIYNKFMKNSGKQLVESFEVSKIIEDKINGFDVEFAESLILDIASKELKAITWLGALLGGIMGLLSPILGSFM